MVAIYVPLPIRGAGSFSELLYGGLYQLTHRYVETRQDVCGTTA